MLEVGCSRQSIKAQTVLGEPSRTLEQESNWRQMDWRRDGLRQLSSGIVGALGKGGREPVVPPEAQGNHVLRAGSEVCQVVAGRRSFTGGGQTRGSIYRRTLHSFSCSHGFQPLLRHLCFLCKMKKCIQMYANCIPCTQNRMRRGQRLQSPQCCGERPASAGSWVQGWGASQTRGLHTALGVTARGPHTSQAGIQGPARWL